MTAITADQGKGDFLIVVKNTTEVVKAIRPGYKYSKMGAKNDDIPVNSLQAIKNVKAREAASTAL